MSYMKLWLVTPNEPTDDEIEKLLSKYQVENKEHYTFIDKTEEYKQEYETEGESVIWKDSGLWHFIWKNDSNEYIGQDQQLWNKNRIASVYKPWKELYPTFRDFVDKFHNNIVEEDGVEKIGYYKNPYGKFDYYSFNSKGFGWDKDLILKDGTETFQAQKNSIDIKEMHWRVRKDHQKGWKLSKVAFHTTHNKKEQLELAEQGIDAFSTCVRHPKMKPYLDIYGNNWPYCFLMNDQWYSKDDMLDIFQYLDDPDKTVFDKKIDEQKALWNKKMEILWDTIPEDHWITVISLHY